MKSMEAFGVFANEKKNKRRIKENIYLTVAWSHCRRGVVKMEHEGAASLERERERERERELQ